ncbi:MAG: hypothetical protein QOH00_1670 [Gaiellales bacterium]|nr:hypothetical protein [Gaiellales bacterium]
MAPERGGYALERGADQRGRSHAPAESDARHPRPVRTTRAGRASARAPPARLLERKWARGASSSTTRHEPGLHGEGEKEVSRRRACLRGPRASGSDAPPPLPALWCSWPVHRAAGRPIPAGPVRRCSTLRANSNASAARKGADRAPATASVGRSARSRFRSARPRTSRSRPVLRSPAPCPRASRCRFPPPGIQPSVSPRRAGARPFGWLGTGPPTTAGGIAAVTGLSAESVIVSPW